uniref:MRG domain-containing protein n=1 Tax=Caenorhabditis tropicalis TaxID=1561998 RepID=A0A1I7TK93_9PELO
MAFYSYSRIHYCGKTPELMNILEPMDLENEESHTYSAVIEPVAGGPMELSILKEKKDDDDHIDVFVFWRLVVEFSEIVPLPKLIEKREKIKEPLYPRKREVGSIQVKDYGMWETLDINTKLAQEKLDLLRSLNDPRVRMIEGPELKPEFQKRKVDVNARRDKMFIALDAFSEQLPMLKSKYYFNYVFEDEFKALYQKLKENDDDFHQYTTKKRSYSLELGMNYLTNLLVNGGVYRSLNEESDFVPMLKVLADCIGLNATYIKKTDDVKNMLHFFRMKKMITYI